MKTPFGNTVAAIKLAEMVENDSKSRRYVASTISEFNNLMLQACKVNDIKATRRFYLFIRDGFIQRIENSTMEPKIKSYLRNILTYRYKKYKNTMELCYDAILKFEAQRKS